MSIHSTAIIDPSSKIGKNVSIGAYAVIGPDCLIQDGCIVWPHTTMEYTTLGAGCIVFPQVSLGLAPQHLKYKGEITRLEVGPRTTFREGVTAHRGTMLDKGITTIGADCYFMALSHIAHDCRIGNSVIMANAAQLAGHVEVGDFCFISTTVGIHQFVRIGTGAMISGGAMVPMDVAPFCTAQGDRSSLMGLNLVGMKRQGFDRHTIKFIKDAYKAIFLSGLRLEEALKEPALHVKNDQVTVFRNFFLDPKRGFVRPASAVSLDEETVKAEATS